MLTLGIESSCDETAASVLRDGTDVLSNCINSQIETHKKYGGVVPELASRQHTKNISIVVREALELAECSLDDIDLLSVTAGPGLIGALLVGFSFAKALSYAKKVPMVQVDHIRGHLLSVFLGPNPPPFPYVAIIASGGHSSLFLVRNYTDTTLLGRTRDDAAGEAFDKVAKLLDLGYPGGPIISQLAQRGRSDAYSFPRAWLDTNSLDFSFSGLKTSVANQVNTIRKKNQPFVLEDICASFQEAVVDVLVEKSIEAAQQYSVPSIVLGGGVAANPRLREHLHNRCIQENYSDFIPPLQYCTDNAAMIALAGYHYRDTSRLMDKDADVYSRSPMLR